MFNYIAPKFIFKVEKWKWNKEYRMYVSNMGHFKDEHKQPVPIMINQRGYVAIKTKNGVQMAHRMVMKTWMPTEDMDNLTVDHLDHNKRNNAVDNLEWVSRKENLRRAKKDFIGSNMMDGSPDDANKVSAKAERRANPNRYRRSDYTFNDMIFIVNGIECDSIQHAYEVAEVILFNDVPEDAIMNKHGLYRQMFASTSLESRFYDMLCCCNRFNADYIDGKVEKQCFNRLILSCKIKEGV